MENLFERVAEKAGKTIRHWWLYLLTGILSIVAGIIVFCNPIESYLTLSLMFGILMLISGVIELVVSATSRNYFTSKGYSIVSGILDIVIGIFLCWNPGLTMIALPVILGVWMMFNSFTIIGVGSDMDSFRIKGSGWIIAGGVILLLLSLGITFCPLTIGTASVVALTGSVLIVFGAMVIALSLRLRRIHEHFRFHDAEVIE
ncbi:MAG TPA: DUF308 domain-containing protein [Candidatus Coprenecus pullistercoris]|nr:DUF308 domain-containing protein [Candidatus Coprenecus pullistercoris]